MTAAEDRKPILVVVAGANGSGKTTLTTQLLQGLVADRFYLWDNSVEGQSPRRILRAVDGRIAREYEPPPHPMAALLRDALLKGRPPSPAPRSR